MLHNQLCNFDYVVAMGCGQLDTLLTHLPKSQLHTSQFDIGVNSTRVYLKAHTQQFNCSALCSCQKVRAVPCRWLRLRLKLCSLVSHSILTQACVIKAQSKENLHLYLLLFKLLANKAALVDVHVTVLKESAVIWQQTKSMRNATARLFRSTSGKVLLQVSLLCAPLSVPCCMASFEPAEL